MDEKPHNIERSHMAKIDKKVLAEVVTMRAAELTKEKDAEIAALKAERDKFKAEADKFLLGGDEDIKTPEGTPAAKDMYAMLFDEGDK